MGLAADGGGVNVMFILNVCDVLPHNFLCKAEVLINIF